MFFVLQGTKENKVLKGDLAIRARKEMTESVQIHVSPVKVPQDHLVCQDLQDPEVCVGFPDHRGPKASRAIWVTWVLVAPLDLWVKRENKGPRETVIAQMGRLGCQETKEKRETMECRDL